MPYNDLPNKLPIFPLHGVLLLPGGRMPLNVFESRYLAMVDDALAGDRLIGIIQPREQGGETLYSVGCAGRITEFVEKDDGCYEIVLSGLIRFSYKEELSPVSGYRRVSPQWSAYRDDILSEKRCLGLDRDALKILLGKYFAREGMECDWHAFDQATDGRLMTCLSMSCPFSAAEKQALLEEESCKRRAKTFITLLEMEVCG